VGCAQVERIDELISAKVRIFKAYQERLKELPLTMNPQAAGSTNGYWMPTVVVNADVNFDREALLKAFHEDNIDGRVFFWPLSSLPMFQRCNHPVAYGLCGRALNLPSYHDMVDADIDRVTAHV